tara:strand:+ start:684 stop:1025 length:342 start_codon:yes stop_codon:yes gene_type:complete
LAHITVYDDLTHASGVTIIDLTTIFYDSNILNNIDHSSFSYTFMKFLYESNSKQLLESVRREEVNAWRPFIDILIPPSHYWNHYEENSNNEIINIIISDEPSLLNYYGTTVFY